MDINRKAEEIIERNNICYKKKEYISKRCFNMLKAKLFQDRIAIGIFGYEKDVNRFKSIIPSYNVYVEYAKPENWMNGPGKDFLGEKQIQKIAKWDIDRLIIVSNDLRYLAQMYLINEDVSYEVIDIYDFIKKEYGVDISGNISNTFQDCIKYYIKSFGVMIADKIEILYKLKFVCYWKEGLLRERRNCDNYDAILVKKNRFLFARTEQDKRYYLQELIINYLLIKDFKNAFYYIDKHVKLYNDERIISIRDEFKKLLSDIKTVLQEKQKKDIVLFWCDSLAYSNFERFNFLKSEANDSLFFENAYTHVPYTHTTIQSIFTGIPFFDGRLNEWNKPLLVRKGKTLDFLENNGYQICEIEHNYIQEKYSKKLFYTVKSARTPAQIIENKEEKNFIICHMACELHPPFWNGISKKMYAVGTNVYIDKSRYTCQMEESIEYLEQQILWYRDYFDGNICKIYMSDHGLTRPGYLNDAIHTFCFVKDTGILKGRVNKFFSYLKFNELLKYIIEPTCENFEDIFSEYILIQNDHPYSRKFCNDIKRRFDKNQEVQWEKWMGFRGIVTKNYKMVLFPNGHEKWFDLADNLIASEEIEDQKLVEFMRDNVGDIFPDISNVDNYKETKKLYEKIGIKV